MSINILSEYFNCLKLFHNEFNKLEESNKLSKFVIEDDLCNEEFSYDDVKTIDDVQKICKWKIKYNYGDLVSFSSYRDTWTYVIGKDGKLIGNACYDGGAGYLTIPYDITKYLRNATLKYSNIDHMYIDLRHDDIWIEHYFGSFDQIWNFTYTWCSTENILIININSNENSYDINLNYQIKWNEFKNTSIINILDDYCIINIKKYLGVIDNNNIKNYYYENL